ncbi:MAG: ribulose bisphosphate carboxylase small subunit [Chromatiales bacterium]|jgi:ribulose-bisphosphate carboxylase small chain|nr:ribulose bisphosphate carboxylase small subunit [Chromatiales bacterium]
MTNITEFPAKRASLEGRRYGTFSYLPPMDADRIRQQVKYLISRGWNPAIEHSEPEQADSDFWYLWKLPLFGEKDVDAVLAELENCHKAFPRHHVRLIGYDNLRQTQGTAMVIYRAA